MAPSDRHDIIQSVFSRAAQYDLQLTGSLSEAGEATFAWRWHHRPLGPQFTNRDLAIDWMAEWLDADTGAQQSPWTVLQQRRDPSADADQSSDAQGSTST
jgi:hypothetical protein